MKSLLIKLYNLQKKLISEEQRKKFFKNKKSSVHSSFKLGINNYIDISENAEITIEEGVTINESIILPSRKMVNSSSAKTPILQELPLRAMKK